MNWNCERARLAMHERLDGEFSDIDRERLEEHCLRCDSCRSVQDELALVDQLLFEVGVEDRVVPATPATLSGPSISRSTITALAACALLALTLFLIDPSTPAASNVAAPPPNSESETLFEVQGDRLLAVKIPSQTPRVNIVWLYQSQKLGQEGTPQ